MCDKIIINEALCYMNNRLDIIDEPTIIRICATSFTEHEIETARNVL